MEAKDRIIVALDVNTADDAERVVRSLKGHVGAFKVGLELVNSAGLSIFERLQAAGADRIFYDCKVHDIPNTVAGAMRSIAKHGLWMTNLHASGGSRMITAARTALDESSAESGLTAPILLGVTLLTSLSAEELNEELSVNLSPQDYVVKLALLVKRSGGNGVVCSPHEIAAIRSACGTEFKIVTPGVRPKGVSVDDQKRVMTPGEAVSLGADYLVIGRAITGNPDPQAAAGAIVEEIVQARTCS